MRMKITKLILIILPCFLFAGCEKEGIKYNNTEGYIVGFDPCTINHHYRIGYVFISTDLNDTLITYNLSDEVFKMPASVLLNPTDTLYKIPESYFQNYSNSAYFPIEAHYKFKIKITYKPAIEEDKVYNMCTTDINQADFNNAIQVIIKSASK